MTKLIGRPVPDPPASARKTPAERGGYLYEVEDEESPVRWRFDRRGTLVTFAVYERTPTGWRSKPEHTGPLCFEALRGHQP